jgi:predicted dehydrogenase
VDDWRRLVGHVDAVSIAAPTKAHFEIASAFLEAGAAVLVEKPMTTDLAQADALIELARRAGAPLGVGHTERFNPAVEELARRTRNPRFIEAHRLGAFAPRSLDVDVVLDLMIHDIDIALYLVGGALRSVDAVGVNALTTRVDIANARLVFESGCVANLTASRISAARTRKIRVFQQDSYLSCDCAERSLEHYRLERTAATGQPAIIHERAVIEDDEPLKRELAAFIAAARGGESFQVPGEAGRAALSAALTVASEIASARGAEVG